MPRGAVRKGIMPSSMWCVCPYCRQESRLVFKASELAVKNMTIPTSSLHKEWESEDVPYTCAECGADFIIKFRVSKIYFVEPHIVEYEPPPTGDALVRHRSIQRRAEVGELLQEQEIGTFADQDTTEQGQI